MAIMSGGPTQVAMSVHAGGGSIPISTVGMPGEGSGRRVRNYARDHRANVHVGDAGCWGMVSYSL